MMAFYSPDYRQPLLDLQHSLNAAKALGYVIPTPFEIAIRLMRGDLRVPLYSDLGGGSAFGIISSGEDFEEEQEEMFALYIKHMKGRKERRRAAEAICAFAIASVDRSARQGGETREAGLDPKDESATRSEAEGDAQ